MNDCDDLPVSAFTDQEPTSESTTSEDNQTHWFKVADRFCHRRNICGRATIVLPIRGVEGGDDEHLLKTMWRDPERGQEGEVLQKVEGKLGLVQYVWDVDAFGKCRCPSKVTRQCQCTRGVVEMAQLEELEVCDKLTDIAIEVPREDEHGGKEAHLEVVDTTVCHPTSRRPPHRIPVFLDMSSKGASLERAESPRQFIQAVLDAILGYWRLFNLGILHRDISEGNVLMLLPGHPLSRHSNQVGTKITEEVLIQSEVELNKVLDELGGREPTGMLSDFDLYSEHSVTPLGTTTAEDSITPSQADVSVASLSDPTSHASGPKRRAQESSTEDTKASKKRKTSHSGLPVTSHLDPALGAARSQGEAGKRLIDFRTGTPAFMSIHAIGVSVGEKYDHSFLDDIESFFWLILWSAAAHLDEGVQRRTAVAQSTLDLFNQHNQTGMATFKAGQLSYCLEDGFIMKMDLRKLGNSWASHRLFSKVIVNFGALVYRYNIAVLKKKNPSPVDVFPEVVRVFLNALSDDSD
ncbi:putative kinase domain protein [Rhizoctonia solani 123E]|uniref:Putative kinase domain protein n=1 Tax=Rhizoctonia solani 123E TaxID=1423351 RepID=A0A074RY50_9AGAM|nr:putative kinase domain protein [Rhizoctonia solani 123E]